MASPLLLGKCPDCKGPRKYTVDVRARLWLRCPSPLCASRPVKVKRGAPKTNVIALDASRPAQAQRSAR